MSPPGASSAASRENHGRLRRWLGHPFALPFSVLASVLLALGTLDDGFTFDDRVHRAIVQRTSHLLHGGPLDLFRTATGDPAQVRPLVDAGAFPWFTQPDLRVAFWRPLASLWHTLDYHLWPDAAWAMHAENVLIHAALVALVGLLLRRTLSCHWAAGLASLLYAVDETHAGAVGWIAARNGLLAATLSIAALIVHHASAMAPTQRRRSLLAFASAALFSAGLVSGELAVGVLGYLVAYAAFIDDRPGPSRLVSLLPYVAITAAWAVAYRVLGYGVRGSGYYVDPIADPSAFLLGLNHNGPSLLVLALGLPASVSTWISATPELRHFVPVAFVLLFASVMVPVLRRDRVARFFGLGMLLSIVPACGTLPQGRLLLLVSLGAVGLIARLLVAVSEAKVDARPWRMAAFGLGALLLLAHGVVAPVTFPFEASAKAREALANRDAIRWAQTQTVWAGRTLVLVHAPHAFSAAEFLFDADGLSGAPARVRSLHVGPGPVVVSRSGPELLTIHDPHGMLREPVSWLFHGLQHPFHPGSKVALDDVTFEVMNVSSGGRPTTVQCRFDRRLEDRELVWLLWRAGRYVPFDPPEEGEHRVVP